MRWVPQLIMDGPKILSMSVENLHFSNSHNYLTVLVGLCHHGMARPQVADRGTASDKEGSCE